MCKLQGQAFSLVIMRVERKPDLDRRLEAYFATLHSSSLKHALKRSMANWQVYAAVSSSAMAMATGASAALLGDGVRDGAPDPSASVRSFKQPAVNSNIPPFVNVLGLTLPKTGTAPTSPLSARTTIDGANQAQAPYIEPGGVVPIFSTVNAIQAGEWITIYGANLAAETASWNGDFPTSLGGTSVTIDGKPGYLMFVSPDQINLQAPDDTTLGTVPVTVTTAAGTATSTVTLAKAVPSFSLFGEFVVGLILRSDGSGAYGAGSYDILGPTGNSLGFATVAAKPGDVVALFGVGFGPTNPAVPAGQPFSGAAPVTGDFHLYINHAPVKPLFVGLSSAGLYQINLIVPQCIGEGNVPIRAFMASNATQAGILFPLQENGGACSSTGGGVIGGGYVVPIGTGFVGGSTGGTMVSPPVGTSGGTGGNGGGTVGNPGGTTGNPGGSGGGTGGNGGGGGTGGGTSSRPAPYRPRLHFGPQ
jgi:uncharacterized protein (TIGR03437 family)